MSERKKIESHILSDTKIMPYQIYQIHFFTELHLYLFEKLARQLTKSVDINTQVIHDQKPLKMKILYAIINNSLQTIRSNDILIA